MPRRPQGADMSDPDLSTVQYTVGDLDIHTIQSPSPTWRCDVLGNGLLIWAATKESAPNAWVRFWMRVFFNSRWEKL